MRRLVPFLVAAAVAAGCGAADEAGQTAAFRAGVVYCDLYPLSELARQEGVAANPEAVARSYSQAEATPKDKEEAYKGCMSALKRRN